MIIYYKKSARTCLRKLSQENSNLISYLIFFLIIHQVRGQFNLNPSNKIKDQYDSNFEEKRYYANQLQNHKSITDQQTANNDQNSGVQLVKSNTIQIQEDNAIFNSLPKRFTTDTFNNYNTQANGLSSTFTTIGSSPAQSSGTSSNLIASSTGNIPTFGLTSGTSTTINDDVQQYPNSQAITKTQMSRLQSTPPDVSSQDYHNLQTGQFSPTSRYGPANSPNNMMSPSLISNIFAKFNQPMGTYYPYGNFGNTYPSYSPNYYGSNYYGSNYYGSGYPSSMGYSGGGFIQNAFYAKMRPLMNFFQSLTRKFNSPYSFQSPYYGRYGGSPYGDVYKSGLFQQMPLLIRKDALTKKTDTTISKLVNTNVPANQQVRNEMQRSLSANIQTSGSDQQFSSVRNKMMENDLRSTRRLVKAIARIQDPTADRPLIGELAFDQSDNLVKINGELKGLSTGDHGLHIYESGASDCTVGSHFNPNAKSQHGGLNSQNRHLGDLGNILSDPNQVARIDIKSGQLTLMGQNSILNKIIAVTDNADDLGLGDNEGSRLNGNSGKIIACGKIESVN